VQLVAELGIGGGGRPQPDTGFGQASRDRPARTLAAVLNAQSRDEKLDQVAGVVAGVAARPGAEIPDAAEQFVGILAGADLARRGGSLKELPAYGDQAVDEVGVRSTAPGPPSVPA